MTCCICVVQKTLTTNLVEISLKEQLKTFGL